VKVLAQGMLDLGLLDRNKAGTVDDVIEKRAYFQFYMHRTGHWLGMDVHDCGSYDGPSQVGEVSERKTRFRRADQEPAQPHPQARHGVDDRARHLRAAGRGVPEQFHHQAFASRTTPS
jgi:Xaa-Pro aminopeptidase